AYATQPPANMPFEGTQAGADFQIPEANLIV
ncbi:MAG: hypothetical protein RLZZ165_1859, partial [Bacteroidota bacterium]